MKKLFIGLLLVFIVAGVSLFLFRRSDSEKCKDIVLSHPNVNPDDYVYIKDIQGKGHCVLKEDIAKEQELRKRPDWDAIVEQRKKDSTDGVRISNLKSILVFKISRYKAKFSAYPKELSDLNTLLCSDSDPKKCPYRLDYNKNTQAYSLIYIDTSNPSNEESFSHYYYAVMLDSTGRVRAYHLGVSLESSSANIAHYLNQDSDFDSKATGWLRGFSGDDSQPCSQTDSGTACYDVKVEE